MKCLHFMLFVELSHCLDVYVIVYETFRTADNTLDALLSWSNATISRCILVFVCLMN